MLGRFGPYDVGNATSARERKVLLPIRKKPGLFQHWAIPLLPETKEELVMLFEQVVQSAGGQIV